MRFLLFMLTMTLFVSCTEVKQPVKWGEQIVRIEDEIKAPLTKTQRLQLIDDFFEDPETIKNYKKFVTNPKGAKAFDELIVSKANDYQNSIRYNKNPTKSNKQRMLLSASFHKISNLNKVWNEVFNK